MLARHQESLAHCKELISLVKAHPKIDNSVYPQLSNYLGEAIKARQFEDFENYLAEFYEGIRTVPDFHEKKLIYERWLLYQIKYLIHRGDFEAVIRLMESERDRAQAYSPLTRYIYFQIMYHLSVACFFSGNYPESWRHIMKILNEADSSQDIYIYAKIFSLIILYERNEADLLPHALRSAYRSLLRRERLYKAEKNILDFIRHTQAVSSRKEAVALFRELAGNLERSFEDPFEQAIQYYFDILRWLRIKTSGKPS